MTNIKKCPRCGVGVVVESSSDYVCTNETCSFRAKKCPQCDDGFLVERQGYSRFLGCINYPDCEYTEQLYRSHGF